MQFQALKWAMASATVTTLVVGFISPANGVTAGAPQAIHAANSVLAATGIKDVVPTSQTTADADSAAIVKVAGAMVEVPKDPANNVTVITPTGQHVGIGISNGKTARDAEITPSGTTVFEDPASGISTAVQATRNGGVRQTVVIPDASAPHEYRVAITFPSGYRLRATQGGTVYLESRTTGDVLGGFAAPWAKDRDGNPVRTNYRVDGNVLIQTVEFGTHTAFPVVADPWWNPFSWNWGKILGSFWNNIASKCATGALWGVVGTASGALVVNLIKYGARYVGPWGYAALAIGGCIIKVGA